MRGWSREDASARTAGTGGAAVGTASDDVSGESMLGLAGRMHDGDVSRSSRRSCSVRFRSRTPSSIRANLDADRRRRPGVRHARRVPRLAREWCVRVHGGGLGGAARSCCRNTAGRNDDAHDGVRQSGLFAMSDVRAARGRRSTRPTDAPARAIAWPSRKTCGDSVFAGDRTSSVGPCGSTASSRRRRRPSTGLSFSEWNTEIWRPSDFVSHPTTVPSAEGLREGTHGSRRRRVARRDPTGTRRRPDTQSSGRRRRSSERCNVRPRATSRRRALLPAHRMMFLALARTWAADPCRFNARRRDVSLASALGASLRAAAVAGVDRERSTRRDGRSGRHRHRLLAGVRDDRAPSRRAREPYAQPARRRRAGAPDRRSTRSGRHRDGRPAPRLGGHARMVGALRADTYEHRVQGHTRLSRAFLARKSRSRARSSPARRCSSDRS